MTDDNKKEVQEKEFYSDQSHDEVSDMMKRTPKMSTLMDLSFTKFLQISFSSIHSDCTAFTQKKLVRLIFEFMVI